MFRKLLLPLVLIALVGCERGSLKLAPAATPDKSAIPVSFPLEREVTDYVDYTGRTNAKESAVVQPRVTGYLIPHDKTGQIAFKEGDFVRKGQELFKIDPRPYQAQFEAAKAAVEQNSAGLEYADVTYQRYKEIAKKQPDAVSPRELDQYQAQYKQATANLKLAEANLEAAKLNLEWTTVRSPIDGQISRYYLTLGNLVNQDVTQLTTVVSLDPMYIYFDMDEPTLLRIKKAVNEGKIRPRGRPEQRYDVVAAATLGLLTSPLPSRLFDAAGALYPGRVRPDSRVFMALAGEEFNLNNKDREGIINFIDNQVNPSTGSISVRGEFPNHKPEGGTYLLVPGMFVRVRLPIGEAQKELLVIDRAITSEQGVKYVYVVDDKNKVEARRVTVGALQEDGLRVITSGLTREDKVLIGGLQQVRPGMVVSATELHSMPSLVEAAVPAEGKVKTKDRVKGKGKR